MLLITTNELFTVRRGELGRRNGLRLSSSRPGDSRSSRSVIAFPFSGTNVNARYGDIELVTFEWPIQNISHCNGPIQSPETHAHANYRLSQHYHIFFTVFAQMTLKTSSVSLTPSIFCDVSDRKQTLGLNVMLRNANKNGVARCVLKGKHLCNNARKKRDHECIELQLGH